MTAAPACRTAGARVLVIDNYDSFVYNLIHYLTALGAHCVVRRNDAPDVADLDRVDGVLVSPGPGTPQRAGASMAVVRACARRGLPVLGVCLGHQAIGQAFGGKVVRNFRIVHGKSSPVHHGGGAIYAGLPSPFVAGRYHSLVVERESLPRTLEVPEALGSVVGHGALPPSPLPCADEAGRVRVRAQSRTRSSTWASTALQTAPKISCLPEKWWYSAPRVTRAPLATSSIEVSL